MGNHQWLPNGNVLITESWQGRAFEVNPRGEIVWEYVNYVDDGVVGRITSVYRLPPEYARLFVRPESGKPETPSAGSMPGRPSHSQDGRRLRK